MSLADQSPVRQFKIKLSTSYPHWPLARQTPLGDGVWGQFRFFINEPVDSCDAWFVHDGLTAPDQTHCPPDNVVFVTAEPAAFRRHPTVWLEQFARVLSTQPEIKHPRVHNTQTGLPWFVARDYATLKAMDFPPKTRLVSAITSSKTTTRGHRLRLGFIRALQAAIPTLEVFGRGLKPVEDKWDGVASFRYSIAIENSVEPDYWTEKIADCFLAGTIPIYHGCPNVADYFPSGSYVPVDISVDHWPATIRQIQTLLETDAHEERTTALRAAKEAVLDQYNLFALLTTFCENLDFTAAPRRVQLIPEPQPSYWARKWLKWQRRWFGA